MKTYQDLEAKEAERKIEWDSILFQIEGLEKVCEEMQHSIIKLKEYLKGSVYFEREGI